MCGERDGGGREETGGLITISLSNERIDTIYTGMSLSLRKGRVEEGKEECL